MGNTQQDDVESQLKEPGAVTTLLEGEPGVSISNSFPVPIMLHAVPRNRLKVVATLEKPPKTASLPPPVARPQPKSLPLPGARELVDSFSQVPAVHSASEPHTSRMQ